MTDFLHADTTQVDADQYLWPQYLIRGGGESVYPRDGNYVASSTAQTSGDLMLAGFVCKRTETTTKVRVWTGGTAAAATPTLCRIGLYERSFADNSLALVASCANDTALFNATNAQFEKNWTTPYRKVKGREYMVGLIVVTGAALPTFNTVTSAWSTAFESGNVENLFPQILGKFAGQTDLPATITAAQAQAAANATFHALVL